MGKYSTRVEEETVKSLNSSAKHKNLRRVVIWFGAMLIGAWLGSFGSQSINELFGFIATVFTRLFQFVAVPVIALAVITTLSSLGARRETGRIFAHTIIYTLATTIVAAAVALCLFLIIAAAAGLGLAFMPKTPNRDVLLKCINGMQDLLFTLIRALLFILPVGIMAFTGQLVSQIQAGVIVGALGQYTAVIIGGNLLQFFVVIPLFLLARGVNPLRVFRGMSPALAVAFFSKSSAGTLPVTLASAEENLRLDHRVTRFVLPICTTINMNGCAAFILVTSLFLMQNAGIVITTGTMIVWLFVAVLAAVGNAGVPMGCYFLTLSLMSSMNVPVDLMGAILPIYAIIDMIETCVNVWSDSSVATMTDHDLRGKLPPEPVQTEAA